MKQTERRGKRSTNHSGADLRSRSAAVRRQLRTEGKSERKLRAAISAYCALPSSEHLPLADAVAAAVKRAEAA